MAMLTCMRGLLLLLVLVLVGSASAECPGSCSDCDSGAFDHSNWQTILDRYLHTNETLYGITNENVFDYEGLRRNQDAEFATYLQQLADLPANWQEMYSESDRFAILINCYNAWAVGMLVQNPTKMRLGKFTWPVRSIRDISGLGVSVWNIPAGVLAGTEQTLQEVEDLVRSYGDPRVHACLVCASASCPNLQADAFRGPVVNLQKNASMTEFLANAEKGLSLDTESGVLTLSPIFTWYAGDFTSDAICSDCTCLNGGMPFASVLDFVATYAPPDVTDYIWTSGLTGNTTFAYNWRMNDYAMAGPPVSFW